MKTLLAIHDFKSAQQLSVLDIHLFMEVNLIEAYFFSLLRLLQAEVIAPARMACSILLSSNDIGCGINGAYLTAWCGRFLTGKEERRTLTTYLEQFKVDTGWPNRTCVDRLRQIWGGTRRSWV